MPKKKMELVSDEIQKIIVKKAPKKKIDIETKKAIMKELNLLKDSIIKEKKPKRKVININGRYITLKPKS